MHSIKRQVKRAINAVLTPFGKEITHKREDTSAGYQVHINEANRLGMDVNDYLEQKLGWIGTLKYLEQAVFPYIREDSIICNLGPATGQGARHVAPRLTRGELHLVDHSAVIVRFLQKYYRGNPRVHVYLNDGSHLPFEKSAWLDLVFSFGAFNEMKLSVVHRYSREFSRVLKPGGYAVIDYFDISIDAAWQYLEKQNVAAFNYTSRGAMERMFTSCGFEIVTPPNGLSEPCDTWPARLLIARKEDSERLTT